MSTKRIRHTAKFKFQIALEATKSKRTFIVHARLYRRCGITDILDFSILAVSTEDCRKILHNETQVASYVRHYKSQSPIPVGRASCPTDKAPAGRYVSSIGLFLIDVKLWKLDLQTV